MGRIADAVSRPRLLAAGLGLWSLMTALGGTASNFAVLSAARRLGVSAADLSLKS
jgi:hypothetical protein